MSKKYWDKKLWSAIEHGEKILVRAVILGFVLLIGVQSMLTTDSLRFYLSWAERLEGQPFQEWSNPSARVMDRETDLFAHLTLEIKEFSSLSKAKILINGQETADFQEKTITIKVYPDDIISVDGSFYNRSIEFEVSQVSQNISHPVLHQVVKTNSNIESFGKVKFK